MSCRRTFIQFLSLLIFSTALFAGGSKDYMAMNNSIEVIFRETGSGTRNALTQLLNIEKISEEKIVADSTTAVIEKVAAKNTAIGYISLGSFNSSVKYLKIDGVKPSVSTIKKGKYKLSRPFILVTKKESQSEEIKDFIRFVLSSAGQKIIEDQGYVPVMKNPDYLTTNKKGSFTIKGSTSVYPVMKKLVNFYKIKNPDVYIHLQETDSSNGIEEVIKNNVDIGLASRYLSQKEKKQNISETLIAIDGIVFVVNKSNPVKNLSSDAVRRIYAGDIKQWSETN